MPKRQKQQRSRKNVSKQAAPQKKQKKTEDDDFFEALSADEELASSEDEYGAAGEPGEHTTESLDEKEDDIETADEKRLRVAKAYLEEIRASTRQPDEDDEDVDENAKRQEAMGARDSLVADILQQAQLEESGRVQRKLAARVKEPVTPAEGKKVGRFHRQSVTAVVLSEDDLKGFAASKDGLIVHWDIETGATEKYKWPDALVSKPVPGARNKKRQPSKNVLALAVSSDGRYLATGGHDRTIHLWDTRTREHLQAFPGHRGSISSLVFRQGTHQLMSASYDRTIKLWSVEDRAYMDTLFGHQSEVLTIDCLRQERVLSAGRDRTVRLWKIPDETQLVFRGHAASMECCCFLTNTEFLSGSDDGCVALWNVMRKKPLALIRSAHGLIPKDNVETSENSGKDHSVPLENKKFHGNRDVNHHEEKNVQVDNEKIHGNGDVKHQQRLDDSVQRNYGVESWVGALAVCRGSDLAASGAGDGQIRLWALEDDNRHLRALYSLPAKGFVNSLAFAKSGRFLIAGLGQEPRLGRWGRDPLARNGVVMYNVLSD